MKASPLCHSGGQFKYDYFFLLLFLVDIVPCMFVAVTGGGCIIHRTLTVKDGFIGGSNPSTVRIYNGNSPNIQINFHGARGQMVV